MKRLLILVLLLFPIATKIFAQPPATASANQSTKLSLNNLVDIAFVSTGGTTATVDIPFSSASDYTNGVESAEQQIRIRSNKDFSVKVKASSNYFTYSGTATDPRMKVQDVLDMKVTQNSTGGSVAGGYSNYTAIKTQSKKILNNCSKGDRNFAVKYKATPGYAYPAGTYITTVVYTVTQD